MSHGKSSQLVLMSGASSLILYFLDQVDAHVQQVEGFKQKGDMSNQ